MPILALFVEVTVRPNITKIIGYAVDLGPMSMNTSKHKCILRRLYMCDSCFHQLSGLPDRSETDADREGERHSLTPREICAKTERLREG